MICSALFDLHQLLADAGHGETVWVIVAHLCGDF